MSEPWAQSSTSTSSTTETNVTLEPPAPRCVWCGEPLRWIPSHGWVHLDGKLYRTKLGPDGVERDDHCALPKAT